MRRTPGGCGVARERPRTGSLYDQGEWVRAMGLETWVVRAGPQGATPVVLLHGIPTSAYLYRDVMRALMEERDCIAFDWPGYGCSEKPRSLEVTHEARAKHLEALLDAVGVRECDLVVHDVAGPAGILFATRHPDRVRRLVVLNTTLSKRDYHPPLAALTQFVPVLREASRPFFTRAAFDHAFKRGLARPKRMQRAVLDHHWRLARRENGLRHVLDTWAAIPEGGAAVREARERMKTFPHPALVLFGADDPYLPPPNAERLAKAFPHATLQLLAGAGHFLQEDAPEEVAERISAFLA